MDPEWRLIERFHDNGTTDNDESREEYDEHCRSVAGVDEAVIKPTHVTMGRQTEETTEQLTLAAARAPTHQPGKQRRHRRTGGLIRHDIPRKSKGATSVAPARNARVGWVSRSLPSGRPKAGPGGSTHPTGVRPQCPAACAAP